MTAQWCTTRLIGTRSWSWHSPTRLAGWCRHRVDDPAQSCRWVVFGPQCLYCPPGAFLRYFFGVFRRLVALMKQNLQDAATYYHISLTQSNG